MKLSNIFKFNTSILRDALTKGDVQQIEALRWKKDNFLSIIISYTQMENMAQPVAETFVNKFTADDWERWGFEPDSRDTVVSGLFARAILAKRADLFDTFLKSDVNLNKGVASQHPLHFAAMAGLPDDVAADLAKRLLMKQTDGIKYRDSLLADAARAGNIAVFDVLAAGFGSDIRRNNDELLRIAAEAGKRDFCRALVETHNAGIDIAITTACTLGHQQVASFLEDLRQEISPGVKPPPTIESLSAEIEQLRATVRTLSADMQGMRAQLSEMQSPGSLEKPALPRPAPAAKTLS